MKYITQKIEYWKVYQIISIPISLIHDLTHVNKSIQYELSLLYWLGIVGTYLSDQGRYLHWMESPPIILSGCDWALKNLNLFNKS